MSHGPSMLVRVEGGDFLRCLDLLCSSFPDDQLFFFANLLFGC